MLQKVYKILLNHFGRQNWWPAETNFEMIIGAILTQQTSWKNVEKAIRNMKKENILDISKIRKINQAKLENIIKPSGFYKLKAKRLKAFVNFIYKKYNGNLESLLNLSKNKLRKQLLSIKGIGKETADSIILYGSHQKVFVVDTYTKRIFNRLGLIQEQKYEKIRKYFEKSLPQDIEIWKEYHALIVKLGKQHCKTIPLCNRCPLNNICQFNNQNS